MEVENANITSIEEENAEPTTGIDTDRVHIKNIPSFIGFKQFRKVLEKILGDLKSKKIRHMSDYAYVTFENDEDAQKAIKLIDGYEIKKFVLSAHLAATEVKNFRVSTNSEPVKILTARESVTPLADEPYEKQLELKKANCVKTMDKLYQQLKSNKVNSIGKQNEFRLKLENVLPSPKTLAYRNKCEFTIGKDLNEKICVGFVGGKFSEKKHFVLPIDDVTIVSKQMKAIIDDVQQFVTDSNLQPFNEFDRNGFWRMLTIREFGGDVMLIFTVFPVQNENETHIEKDIKDKIAQRYLDSSTLTEKKFRVSSIYWQRIVHCSDTPNYELVAGTPYIYESLLDCRFRVSPSAFFQTNSQAASVLYSTIQEICDVTSIPTKKVEKLEKDEEDEEEIAAKKAKIEENKEKEEEENNTTILLDICCGTGTIGQCLLKNVNKNHKICCIGVEMIAEAIEDARQNAKQNKLEERCKYIAGKAEDVFKSMKYHLPQGFHLRKSKVVGVLDPPRAGMHEKVILACREMETMKRLVFVSCEPNAAMKNIVDLCRPTSRKFGGDPFKITKVQPVDMFPQTNHVEWIIQLDR